MSHTFQSANVPKSLAVNHRRIVHFERLFPPENVYKQRTDGMAKRVELQQTDGNMLCYCTKTLEQLLRVPQKSLQGYESHIRRVKHCAMNHKAWMQTRAFASPLALLLDCISSSERSGIILLPSPYFNRKRIPREPTNQVSLVVEGKNLLDSGRFSGIVKAIPPIIA